MTSPDASILEVAQLMRQHHVGDVIVVVQSGEQTIPMGIITDRDLAIEILAEGVSPEAVTAGDVMSSLVTIPEKAELWETLEYMRYKGIRRMPVVNEARELVGILTVDDALNLLSEGLSDLVKLIKHEMERETHLRSRP